jgi:hypothetical protein
MAATSASRSSRPSSFNALLPQLSESRPAPSNVSRVLNFYQTSDWLYKGRPEPGTAPRVINRVVNRSHGDIEEGVRVDRPAANEASHLSLFLDAIEAACGSRFDGGTTTPPPVSVPPATTTPGSSSCPLPPGWHEGATVGLRHGAEIRVGPGEQFPVHTTVPGQAEQPWNVVVISKPFCPGGAGDPWIDVSRKAAGDPSGGTGYVRYSQAAYFGSPSSGASCSGPLVAYRDMNFEGPCLGLNANEPNLQNRTFSDGSPANDRIRSVKCASGYVCSWYEHAQYQGSRAEGRTGDISHVGGEWHDRVSGLRFYLANGPTGTCSGLATLYAGPNESGACIGTDADIADLQWRSLSDGGTANDRVVWLRVAPGVVATVCNDAGGYGGCFSQEGPASIAIPPLVADGAPSVSTVGIAAVGDTAVPGPTACPDGQYLVTFQRMPSRAPVARECQGLGGSVHGDYGDSPAPGGLVDWYGVHASTSFWATAGDYRLTVHHDDGITVRMNGVVVYDKPRDPADPTPVIVRLPQSGMVEITFDWHENAGYARYRLVWELTKPLGELPALPEPLPRQPQVIQATAVPSGPIQPGSSTTISAQSTSGVLPTLSVETPAVCRVEGVVVLALAAGDCIVRIGAAETEQFLAAEDVMLSIKVGADKRLNQTVTMAIPSMYYSPEGSFVPAVKSSSGESWTVASLTSGVCQIGLDSSVVVISTGKCELNVSVAGNAKYKPASKSFVVTVRKGKQTLELEVVPGTFKAGTVATVVASSTAGLPVSLTASGACKLSGNALTFTQKGTCRLSAAQGGSALYESATTITRSMTVK